LIRIELHAIEVYGYHGVEEDERRDGQRFLFDVDFDVGDDALSDRIEDAVDYREVAALVRELSDARQYRLLEPLAAAVAEAIRVRFPVERVRVCVRKPEVRLDPPAEWSAVTVER